jgi:uncharacterized protein (DUF1800 family)
MPEPRPKATRRVPFSRRQVLAGAGVAAGGLGLARLLGMHDVALPLPGQPAPSGTSATGAQQDWIAPLDRTEAQVAHLLRRATFGYTRAEYSRAVSDGFRKTVDRFIETPPAEPDPFPGGDDAARGKPLRVGDLQAWWLSRMIDSPTPFAERMTFFWHGHFTSDFRKVTPQTPFIYWQNLTWRRMALGDLHSMLYQVTIDPGMLRYLDLATSTGKSPNENYSRELMELFTMGAGHFGEDDVRAGAKALAGWREPITQAMYEDLVAQAQQRGRTVPKNLQPDTVKTGVFEPARAYSGAVTFLGVTKRWDAQAVVDRILEQDATAPFIVTKVLREFVTDAPADAYVKRLADGFRKSGYDMKTLMRDVFTSPEFVAAPSYRALVKSPTELMVSTAKAVENPQLVRLMVQNASGLGQSLFDPPEVGGWPSNASWVSSAVVLARINFTVNVLSTMPKLPAFKDAHTVFLDGVVGPKTAELLNQTGDEASRWLIVLASPEFQLK